MYMYVLLLYWPLAGVVMIRFALGSLEWKSGCYQMLRPLFIVLLGASDDVEDCIDMRD